MGGERAMSELACKHCGSGSFVRNGMAAGHQRYRCKTCGRNCHVAVYEWIKAAGEEAPAPSTTPEDNIVQIDEMWHFVDGKKTRSGSGGPTILWHGEPWPGSWVGAMTRPANGSSTRSASGARSS